jgi:hypothetical protein
MDLASKFLAANWTYGLILASLVISFFSWDTCQYFAVKNNSEERNFAHGLIVFSLAHS